jgi:DNA double-strand break repair helicase HerA and related ATPase
MSDPRVVARTAERQPTAPPGMPTSPFGGGALSPTGSMPASLGTLLFGSTGARGGHHEGLPESTARRATRSVGSNMGRQLIRGLLGSFPGRRR